jgi:hypothetical protein
LEIVAVSLISDITLEAPCYHDPRRGFCSAGRARLLAAVTATVARLIAFEAGLGRLSWTVLGPGSLVAVLRIKVIIHMAMEVGLTVEPPTSADEYPAVEPLRTVVAVGGALVRRNVIVTIGAGGFDADLDSDLSVRLGCWDQQE